MDISRLMLVDDDQNIRRITELVLTRVGKWEATLAASGKEALEMIESVKPDVVLLDVMMPEMDGPTVFAKIKERESLRHTPVIFMTAKVQNDEVDGYLALGAAGVITKPFDPKSLPDQIRSIVEAWVAPRQASSFLQQAM